MSPRPPVYIAAPFTAPVGAGIAANVGRACALARLAVAYRLAPIVVHPAVAAGAYGNDDSPQERAAGLDCDEALVQLVARHPAGQLWVLRRADGSLSSGVAVEVAAWNAVHRGKRVVRGASWAQWWPAFRGQSDDLGALWATHATCEELEACARLLTGGALRVHRERLSLATPP